MIHYLFRESSVVNCLLHIHLYSILHYLRKKRDDQKANYPESRESIREWFVLRFCVDGGVEFVLFFVLGCGMS